MAWERERERIVRQDSSGVLAFRIAVMLSCLILVPAAAIFGSAFPELVQSQLVDRLKSLADLMPQDEPATAPDPRLAVVPTAALDTAPAWNTGEIPSAPAPIPAWQPAVASEPYPATVHQVEYSESETAVASAPNTPQALSQPCNNGDYFTGIQQRLRDYGASYYALEAVGRQNDLYRFACRMIDAQGQARDFSATDRDALQAMHRVMRDVEAWHGHALAPDRTLRR